VILGAALLLSLANPGYVDRGREVILLNLYERQSAERMRGSGQYNQAVMRGDVLYKFNKFSGSITATTKNGLMVDGDGQIWVVVRYKNNPGRVKQAWYIGDSTRSAAFTQEPLREAGQAVERFSAETIRAGVRQAARLAEGVRRARAAGAQTRREPHVENARRLQQQGGDPAHRVSAGRGAASTRAARSDA
jgi:hypothetical protein